MSLHGAVKSISAPFDMETKVEVLIDFDPCSMYSRASLTIIMDPFEAPRYYKVGDNITVDVR